MSNGFRSSCYWTDWNWANTENIRIGLVFAVLAQWKFLNCIDRFDHIKANKSKLINKGWYKGVIFAMKNQWSYQWWLIVSLNDGSGRVNQKIYTVSYSGLSWLYPGYLLGYIFRLIAGYTVRANENQWRYQWRLIASLNDESGRMNQRIYNVSYSGLSWLYGRLFTGLYFQVNSIHLLTGYEGNSTFIVPKVRTIFRCNAEENSWYRGDN